MTASTFDWLYPANARMCGLCGEPYSPHKSYECCGLICVNCWLSGTLWFKAQVLEEFKNIPPRIDIKQWMMTIYKKM